MWKCPKYTAFKTMFAKLTKKNKRAKLQMAEMLTAGQTRTTGPQINATQPAISPVPSHNCPNENKECLTD